MYYEKCIKNYDNKKLIKLSQLRRNLIRHLYDENNLKIALDYYNAFLTLLDHDFTVSKQPMFEWNNAHSTCFLFEKINIQQLISEQYEKAGTKAQPIEAKKHFFEAMKMNVQNIKDLDRYLWEDSDLLMSPILQSNFHYSKLFENTSQYYYSMYKYSLQNDKDTTLFTIRRAYHYKTFTNLWNKQSSDEYKSLALLEMAKKLNDDQCGEKLALIQEYKDTPQCQEFYTKWHQQNECVYYKPINTALELKPFTLKEAFQDLSKMFSQSQTTQKA